MPINTVRADFSLDRVESIRGGSASTFASNSPGGIIHLISKTGEQAGGSVGVSYGVDYQHQRVDFDYGQPLTDEWRFHIGGFVREGEGIRDAGFNAESGNQIKFNATREFDNGYLRFYAKRLTTTSSLTTPHPRGMTAVEISVLFRRLTVPKRQSNPR